MTAELLQEVLDSLAEAVEREQSIRFGHEAARVLHAALLDVTDKPHEHAWQPLGYDRADAMKPARVVSACACGEALEATP